MATFKLYCLSTETSERYALLRTSERSSSARRLYLLAKTVTDQSKKKFNHFKQLNEPIG